EDYILVASVAQRGASKRSRPRPGGIAIMGGSPRQPLAPDDAPIRGARACGRRGNWRRGDWRGDWRGVANRISGCVAAITHARGHIRVRREANRAEWPLIVLRIVTRRPVRRRGRIRRAPIQTVGGGASIVEGSSDDWAVLETSCGQDPVVAFGDGIVPTNPAFVQPAMTTRRRKGTGPGSAVNETPIVVAGCGAADGGPLNRGRTTSRAGAHSSPLLNLAGSCLGLDVAPRLCLALDVAPRLRTLG